MLEQSDFGKWINKIKVNCKPSTSDVCPYNWVQIKLFKVVKSKVDLSPYLEGRTRIISIRRVRGLIKIYIVVKELRGGAPTK